MKRSPLTFGVLLLLGLSTVQAEVRPNSLFADHAVLQREAKVPVWGTAKDGETVTVEFGGQKVSTVARDGKWKVQLDPMPANATGHPMTITGENTFILRDILVGDVWLCSGQSNMVKTIKSGTWCSYGGVQNADQEASGSYPLIRTHDKASTGWSACDPATLPRVSAVAFFFGRELHTQLRVPIGLVIRAVGGSAAESWTPAKVLERDADFTLQQASAKIEHAALEPLAEEDQKLIESWKKESAAALANGKPAPARPALAMTQVQQDRYQDLGPILNPGTLYPQIRDLVPMAFKGCIWYQGESNARRGVRYARLLSLMIEGWRSEWGVSFPFLIVQLPNYGEAIINDPHQGCYPLLREAQMNVAQNIPGTGIVPTLDAGEAKDIHPGNKQAVGYRLAQLALQAVYGRDAVASGPRYRSAEFHDGKAVVAFTGDTHGLVLKADGGFELAGADQKWHPATAVIHGDTLEVSSPAVPDPVAVRYGYLNNPPVTLFNPQGWPAFPFRSDSWQVSTGSEAAPRANAETETRHPRDERVQWWREAKFGLFLHWGPVAQAGTELSWSRKGTKPLDITGDPAGAVEDPVYDNLYKTFNPAAFDAREWVRIAKESGMKYIVLTCKHHDGFSLFHTEVSDYSIAATPFRRDIVRELADACHEAGLRFGVYYSPRDWHHPDYGMGDNRKYLEFMNAQIRELLTRYGTVDILWWDSYGKGDLVNFWRIGETFDLVRSLQPGIVMNNRMAVLGAYNKQPSPFLGDFDTPEQTVGRMQTGRPWESCIPLVGRQWSYQPNGKMLGSAEVIQTLVTCATGDGNLLLNIGPMPTGEIEPRQVEVLKAVGSWLHQYGHTVYGTRGGPLQNGAWGGTTYRNDTVYLHVLRWPGETLRLHPMDEKIVSSRILTGGSAKLEQTDTGIAITVPATERDPVDTVIELKLDRPVGKIYENRALVSIFDDPGYGSLISNTTTFEQNAPAIIDLGSIRNVKGVRISSQPGSPLIQGTAFSVSEDKSHWLPVSQKESHKDIWEVPVTQTIAGAKVAGVRAQYLKLQPPDGQPLLLKQVEVFGN